MRRWSDSKEACANGRSHSAPKTEAGVWEKVRAYLMSPETLRADLERAIEFRRAEMRGDPEREVKAWLEKLSEADNLRRAGRRADLRPR